MKLNGQIISHWVNFLGGCFHDFMFTPKLVEDKSTSDSYFFESVFFLTSICSDFLAGRVGGSGDTSG